MLATTLGYNAHFTRENKIELLKNVKYPVFPQIYISCPHLFFFVLYHRELHFPGFLLSDFWETWPMGGLGGTWEGGRTGESRYISPLLFLLPGTSPEQLLLLISSSSYQMGFSSRSQLYLASLHWF